MNVRQEGMCHGDGKIYLQIELERAVAGSSILLDARLKNGQGIPAHLFPLELEKNDSRANYVVVIPRIQAREIDLRFTEYGGSDTPLSQARLTLETSSLRWATRFNTLIHNDVIDHMFDIEREYCADRMNVYFTDAIDDGEEVVVKAFIDLPFVDNIDMKVRFQDEKAQELDLPLYPLFDEIVPAKRLGEEDRLQVGFSIRIVKESKDFCVSVYDANNNLPGGFAMFCDETYEPLRDSFLAESTHAAEDERYHNWYHRHCATLADLALQRRLGLPSEPQVSLVLPLYPGDYSYIPEALEALHVQTYRNFELVVVDACGDDYYFDSLFAAWETKSKVIRIPVEASTSEAQARLIGMMQSTGQWCAVLESRVLLAPEALYEFVRSIDEAEKAGTVPDALYCHHDCYSREQGFYGVEIKPAFSRDYLYSFPYCGPFVLYRRLALDHIAQGPGFSSEAFDYDLLLKVAYHTQNIQRIDQVLYHINYVEDPVLIEGSTYAQRDELTFRDGRKALSSFLRSIDVQAVVLADAEQGCYHVKYRLPTVSPSLAVVIPNLNQAELLEACVSSLLRNDGLEAIDVVIVDNQSTDEDTLAYYQAIQSAYTNVHVLAFEGEFSMGAMVNYAASQTQSDYLLVLHNDTECIEVDTLTTLLAHASLEDIGVLGAKLLYSDDTIQHAGIAIGQGRNFENLAHNLPRKSTGYGKRLVCPHEVSAVSSACMLIKRSVFDEVGGFREAFKQINYDLDFCLRVIQAGYRVVIDTNVELYHHDRATRGHILTPEQRMRTERERAYFNYLWPQYFLEGDPFMSLCLNPYSPYYQLSFE